MCIGEVPRTKPVSGIRDYFGEDAFVGFNIEQMVQKAVAREAFRYWHVWKEIEISQTNWERLMDALESRASKKYNVVLDDVPAIRLACAPGTVNIRPSAELNDLQINLVST